MRVLSVLDAERPSAIHNREPGRLNHQFIEAAIGRRRHRAILVPFAEQRLPFFQRTIVLAELQRPLDNPGDLPVTIAGRRQTLAAQIQVLEIVRRGFGVSR